MAPPDALGREPVSQEVALREFREQQERWTPRTALGRRLKQLRDQFISEGGRLLTPEEVEAEVRERRGGGHTEE